MSHPDNETIIAQTKKWIIDVVVGCNFCPFAAKEFKRGSIHYEVLHNATVKSCLEAVMHSVNQLNNEENIETTLLILPGSFPSFDKYLQLLDMAETLLTKEGYEGYDSCIFLLLRR